MNYYAQVDNNGMLNKLVMGLVMIQLHQGDYVAAEIAFKQCLRWVQCCIKVRLVWHKTKLLFYCSDYAGVAESEEAQTIQAMLDAWDEGDGEAVERYLKSPLFRFMENEVTPLYKAHTFCYKL